MFSDMGINVIEHRGRERRIRRRSTHTTRRVARSRRRPCLPSRGARRADRSDRRTRLRLYCARRERWVLSREGEIAIAKRSEAVREAMTPACAEPADVPGHLSGRDELNDGKVQLRASSISRRLTKAEAKAAPVASPLA